MSLENRKPRGFGYRHAKQLRHDPQTDQCHYHTPSGDEKGGLQNRVEDLIGIDLTNHTNYGGMGRDSTSRRRLRGIFRETKKRSRRKNHVPKGNIDEWS